MNTNDLQEITLKDWYEISGGYDEKKMMIEQTLDKICTQIKDFLNP